MSVDHRVLLIATVALLGAPAHAAAAPSTTVECPDGWTNAASSCTVTGTSLIPFAFRFVDNVVTVDDAAPYLTEENPAEVAIATEGRHRVTATTDEAELAENRSARSSSAPASDTLDIDLTAPVGTAPDDDRASCPVTFTDVQDALSGVDAASFVAEYRRGADAWAPLREGAFDAVAHTYAAAIPAAGCTTGQIDLRLRVSDVAGNAATLIGRRTLPVAQPSPSPSPSPSPPDDPPPEAVTATPAPDALPAPQAQLACSARRLQLVGVRRAGLRTQLEGVADTKLAGRRISLMSGWDGREVARATVDAAGRFSATAPLPPAGLRNGNRARYVARLGSQHSPALKFSRRMTVSGMVARGGRVVFAGRVIGPLARAVHDRRIELRQRVDCHGGTRVVASTVPDRNGRFRFRIKAPEGRSATYRAVTSVQLAGARRTVVNRTFTLPRAVDLG